MSGRSLFLIVFLVNCWFNSIGSTMLMNEIQSQSESISRLPRSVSVSAHPIRCDDYFNSIFVKTYPLATGIQINFEHSIKPQKKLNPSGADEFKISYKLFVSHLNDESETKKYHSATVFIPSDLNFKDAFQNRIKNHTRPYGITADFRHDHVGEVITCSGPVKGMLLLSSGTASKSKLVQQEVDFVIKKVPLSKKIQFYTLFIMDASGNGIIRDLVTVQAPNHVERDDDDDSSTTSSPIANISSGDSNDNSSFGRRAGPKPKPKSSQGRGDAKENQSNTQIASSDSNDDKISVSEIEKRMGKILREDAAVRDAATTNYRVDPKYLTHVIPDYIIHVKLIYTGCGSNYSCFEHPADCHHTRNCLVNLRFNRVKGGVRMIITASTTRWVAVGLSEDRLMGDDAVVICRRAPNSALASLWDAYNPPRPDVYTLGTVIHAEKHAYLRPTAGSSGKGILTCEFQLDKEFKTESNLDINFVNKKYYILLSVGLDNKEPSGLGSVRKHEFAITSSKPVHFYEDPPVIIQYQKHMAITVHEQLAIISYGFLVPAAILMSRYGQHGLHRRGFGNYPWWFIIHVSFQMGAIVCNVLGLFIIYMFRNGSTFYSPSSIFHGIVGPAVYIMSFANAILGCFMHVRRNRSMSESVCLKWCHWGIGHFSAFLGALEIIRGPAIPKSWISCSFSVVGGFNYVFFCGASVLLMFNTEILRQKLKSPYPTYRSFLGPAIELNTNFPRKTFYERRYIIYFTLGSLFFCTVILLVELVLTGQPCNGHLQFDIDLVMAAIDCSDVLGDIIAEWNEADLTDDLHIVFDMANLGLNDSNTNLEDELQLTFSLENATTGEEVKFESIALVLPSTNPYARSESNSSNDIEESNEIYASFKDETFGEVLNCFRPFSCLILMSYPNSPSNLNHQEVEIKVKNIPAMEIEAYIQLRLRDKIVVGDVLTIQNSVDDEFDSETPFEATFTSQAAWEETDASIWEGSEEIHYGEVDGKVDAFTNVDMDENLYESVFRDTDETEPNFDPGVMAEVDIEDAGIDTYTGVEADSNPVLPDKNIRVSDYTIEEEENAGGDKNSSKVAPSKNISNMSALPQRIHVRSITSPPEDNKTTVPPSHSKPPGQVRRGHKLRPKSTEAIMQQKKFRSLGGNPASQGAGVSKAKSASELRLGRRIKPHLKPGESSRKFRRSHRNMINISTNSTKHVSSITFLRLGHRRLRQKGSTSTNKMAKHRSATNQLRILGFGVNTSATSKPSITSLRRGFKRLPKRTEAQRTIVAKRRLDSTILEGFTRIKQRSRKPSAGGRPIKGSLRSMGTIIGSPNSKVISSSASRRVFGPRKELTKADKEKLAQSMKKFQSQHNLSSTSTSKSPKRRSSRRTKLIVTL
ncbi:unnamed protein product [Allacma fusca]|uniref:ascorbate ferrireductase (transmembrane) n=1 Tax=Allacma fusca TaxID=39272 RepID=A0A8J2LTH9_9HEXA|nr:unnamed protein product [Allacma fusca]